MRQETQDDFDIILDCFMGLDGAVSFVRLRELVNRLDDEAARGNEEADKVCIIIRQFANLVRVAAGKDKLRE